MASEITVCICTYGDERWMTLAERALASVLDQTTPPADVIMVHGKTLSGARNQAAQMATSKYLVFLDADDELDSGYIEAMDAIHKADIVWPATVHADGVDVGEVTIAQPCNLFKRNFIIIGAKVNREKFLAVGGFNNYPILEDWDLWVRMWIQGALYKPQPKAIYKVHVNTGSRNKYQNDAFNGKIYQQIRLSAVDLARQVGFPIT